MQDGLIMMGDLPRWKMMVSLWRVTYSDARWSHYDGWPTHMQEDGLIVMGDLPKQEKIMEDGLIMMGDLSRRKMMVSLWWVTYLYDGLIMMSDLPK